MRYALIGCGRISVNHIAAALANGLDIVAICDLDSSKMSYLIEKFNLSEQTKCYNDYNDMLASENIELVAVATESGRHAKIALDCLKSGCNVIIEKPIALSMSDAEQIVEMSKKNGLKVCVSHQNRFNKSIAKIREAYENKRFGKIFYGTAHIRWNRGQSYYAQAPWRGTWEQDGGALMNQCIHNIDLLRWMLGEGIDEVFAYTDNLNHDYIEAEDMGIALLKFKNGAYGIIEGTTDIFPKNLEETLYIFGEKGTVKAGGKSVNKIEEWMFADNLEDSEHVKEQFREDPPNVYGFGHTPLYADMIAAIQENRKPYIDAQDGMKALEVVLAIYKSASEGRPVKLPLTDCSTLDFVGRFNHGTK